jgi:hypothetical protein
MLMISLRSGYLSDRETVAVGGSSRSIGPGNFFWVEEEEKGVGWSPFG